MMLTFMEIQSAKQQTLYEDAMKQQEAIANAETATQSNGLTGDSTASVPSGTNNDSQMSTSQSS